MLFFGKQKKLEQEVATLRAELGKISANTLDGWGSCLLYTSPSPRDS